MRRPGLRASDNDRDQVAERLRQAAAEGRLIAEELERRLEAALSARTYGELDPLVADLPGPGRHRRAQLPWRSWVAVALALAIAIPVLVAVVAAVLVAVTGVLAVGGLWLLLEWWVMGPRLGLSGPRRPRYKGRRRAWLKH